MSSYSGLFPVRFVTGSAGDALFAPGSIWCATLLLVLVLVRARIPVLILVRIRILILILIRILILILVLILVLVRILASTLPCVWFHLVRHTHTYL